MTSRARLNLVLLVIVVGLAIIISLAPENDVGPNLEPLSHEDARAISRIRLELATGETIELRRSGDEWRLIEPMKIAANAFRVDTLLTVLGAPVHTSIDAPAESLSRYGLAPPRARLELDNLEILFGDTEPIHGRRYLLYDGRVALVDDAYFSYLASSAANYVDLTVLGPNAKPRRIELPDRSLYRDGDSWRAGGAVSDIGADEIARVVQAWRNARATAVRPYDPSLNWSYSIRVELAEEEISFDVAPTEYEFILGRRDLGIQYHLTKGAGARLLGVEPAQGDGS